MKTFFRMCILAVALAACSPGNSTSQNPSPTKPMGEKLDGTVGGGGGNTIPASDEEIVKAIKEVWVFPEKLTLGYTIRDGFYGIYFSLMNNNEIKDTKLREIFDKFYKRSESIPLSDGTYAHNELPVFELLGRIKYDIKLNEPCYNREKQPKPASVAYNKLGSFLELLNKEEVSGVHKEMEAGICYSVPLLRNIPKASLHDNLLALTAHEVTHLFGYESEEQPNLVQQFFLEEGKGLTRNDVVFRSAEIYVSQWNSYLNKLDENILSKGTDAELCKIIGYVRQISLVANDFVWTAWRKSLTPDRPLKISTEAGKFSDEAALKTYSMLGFCGEHDEGTMIMSSTHLFLPAKQPNVAKGNREDLKSRLPLIKSDLKKLNELLGVIEQN